MTTQNADNTTTPSHGEEIAKGDILEAHKTRSLSMHDGIPVWYDCCSCETEPYWEEALEQASRQEEQNHKAVQSK
jgi:hypothetical protein